MNESKSNFLIQDEKLMIEMLQIIYSGAKLTHLSPVEHF